MADQRWRGEKKQQMRKEPDPHQSLKWILKRTKVNRLFQLRRSDCFSVLEPSLISRASCCLKSQHCSRCLTWRVKNPASLYFFLPHRNAMNRFFFQLCSARCISRKQSENVRKTIGTPARCRLAAALKSTWNENDLVFFFFAKRSLIFGGTPGDVHVATREKSARFRHGPCVASKPMAYQSFFDFQMLKLLSNSTMSGKTEGDAVSHRRSWRETKEEEKVTDT